METTNKFKSMALQLNPDVQFTQHEDGDGGVWINLLLLNGRQVMDVTRRRAVYGQPGWEVEVNWAGCGAQAPGVALDMSRLLGVAYLVACELKEAK
jgi:hypothetical protein